MEKMDAKLIIFDLDGTLIDSKRDIAYAVNATLGRMGLDEIPVDTIYSYVGNGVRPLIEKAVAAAGRINGIDTAIRHFQELYIAHLLDTTVMFSGIPEVLEHFHGAKKMAVASNKPIRYVEKIMEGLGMTRYFISVKGGDSVKEKKPDPEMLKVIMDEAGESASGTVFVGDSAVDIITGKNAGVRTVGVTYGFRPCGEIYENSPDKIIHAPSDIKELFE